MTLTKAEIAELERLCEAATEEPWFSHSVLYSDQSEPIEIRQEEGDYILAELDDLTNVDKENAAFIVAARTALPKLLAERKELQIEVEMWKSRAIAANAALKDSER